MQANAADCSDSKVRCISAPLRTLYTLFFLPVFGLFLCASEACAEDKKTVDQVALSQRLIIPAVQINSAWPDEVFHFIRYRSKQLDPGNRGVNLVLNLRASDLAPRQPVRMGQPSAIPGLEDVQSDEGKATLSGPVTLVRENASLLELIQATAESVGLDVTFRGDGIFVHPRGKNPPQNLSE